MTFKKKKVSVRCVSPRDITFEFECVHYYIEIVSCSTPHHLYSLPL